jgi:hypothetical protein
MPITTKGIALESITFRSCPGRIFLPQLLQRAMIGVHEVTTKRDFEKGGVWRANDQFLC